MILFVACLLLLGFVFGLAQTQGDKIAARYPILKRPLAVLGHLAGWMILIGIVAGVVWINNRPPPPPKPLPENISPPPLEGTAWTVYDLSAKDKAQLSLDLSSRKSKDGYTQVWTRYDNNAKQETTLTLTRYECEFGRRSDLYDVYYEKGAYAGYDEDDPKDESKVDLETVEGSGFLLACFDKKPSVVDND